MKESVRPLGAQNVNLVSKKILECILLAQTTIMKLENIGAARIDLGIIVKKVQNVVSVDTLKIEYV